MSARFVLVRGVAVLVAGCCALFALGGCSLGPDDLPSVRGGTGAGFTVGFEFLSVMNLPNGADVMMDGLRVGEVRDVAVLDDTVRVTVGVHNGSRIPADVRAVIRQNTLLGDTYIALDHGTIDPDGRFLGPGGVVAVDRTSSPPQLEDTMAVLAYFVNGGSIRRIQDAMGRINTAMPASQDVRRLASVVAVDLRDLAHDTGEIDRLLDGFDATAVALNAKAATLATLFAPETAHYWRRVAVDTISYISQILPSVGSVYQGGLWLVPMLNSLADSGAVMRDIWTTAPADAAKLSDFLRTTVLPFAQHPSVDIRSIESPRGEQMVADVENLLRILGAVK
ncbi:MlaD family protein [Nocardia bovistercoris]|uniref:MCE family protein n=1 Tax=Nocardia bovistercoris TaxID=2785916 RepID=A0A931IIL8_9NOCA|nr:MlaD family protein [Nocardia bovistercoris]MBH0781021.1 MCE family protein [Nocardia bovistercoris]